MEPKQGLKDDTAANSIAFACSSDRNTDLIAHGGWFGEWQKWMTYCPGDSYICGLQVRIEEPGGDDTALNGLRIACCGFPIDNATAIISTTSIVTGTDAAGKLCVEINEQAVGNSIEQVICRDFEGQLFVFTSTLTGAFTISAVPSGLCLQPDRRERITLASLAPCNGTANQMWAVTPVGGGYYRIRSTNGANGLLAACLDVYGGSNKSGQTMDMFDCNDSAAQRFKLDLPTRATSTSFVTKTR
ncbi:hypothetical protein GPECTOR_58g569 [Gonium pectorale]|uniref:Ricin B lectin domain-containing protein n=1 Tax=Gonium pectorale TaxID=33097 RepID=A0A150G704_GONPE|nr:hypothetical protein GPECTOR_58g569 [Gonium pectorale]|eukprot:KXZ45120.1 hypothetical protein GPECTOR_58g569 [Gonium pectorale]